jgi:O-antigen ligase
MTARSLSLLIWSWIFIIPLTFNFWGLDPALYSKFLFLDVSLVITSVLLYLKSNSHYAISRSTLWFTLLYGSYILLSVISLNYYAINKADGWFAWLHLFTLPAFVLLLLLTDQHVKIQRSRVSLIISSLAGVSIVIGLIQYSIHIYHTGWYLAASDVMRSTYAHKNIFSEVMLLTLPFSVFAGFYDSKKRWLNMIISIATPAVIAMLLSRAVWLGLLGACFVTAFIYFIANGRTWIIVLGTLSIILCVVFCCEFYHWFIWHTNTGDYLHYFYQKRDTINERKHLWAATWQIIKQHLLIGNGMGSWKILNMRYGVIGLRNYTTFFQQPHNDYLWVLSEQGVLALIAAGSAWILILYKLIRQIIAAPSDKFLYCLLFALTGYGVYAGMAFPKERAEHAIILSFIVFFILSSDSDRSISFPRYLLLPIGLILAIGAWWSCNKMTDEIHLRQYFEARSRYDVSGEQLELSSISPTYYTVDETATPIAWYSGMLDFSRGNATVALAHFEQAVKANPYHVYSLCNVGTCLNMKGDKAGAENYFKAALEYSPGFPDAALNLCAIKFNEGKIDSAAMYLGMVNDSLSNSRYVKSLNILTQAVTQPMINSLKGEDMALLRSRVISLSKKNNWQSEIFKKAYIYHLKIQTQILKDMIWSIRTDDHDSIDANKYENQLIKPQP